MAAKLITEQEKILTNEYIHEHYYPLICSLVKNYLRYLTPYIDYIDVIQDTYIRLCIIYYYPYNYAKIDQRYLVTRSIIQILDTRFRKGRAKIRFDQDLYRPDSDDYTEYSKDHSHNRPCEKTVMCKYHVDKLFNFIKYEFPLKRFWNKPKILNVITFLKYKFLKFSKFNVHTIGHAIDVLGNNLYLCEEARRTHLFGEYRRWLKRNNKGDEVGDKNYIASAAFHTACNYFLVRVRMFFYSEGLFDYLMKAGE